MKIIAILYFVFTSLLVSSQSDTEQIRKLMQEQERAWNTGDINGFMQYYWKSDSLTFIGKSGITYGWQKTLDNYKRNYPDNKTMGKLIFRLICLEQLSSSVVYVTGLWHLERENPVGGYFTLLWKKINGEWRIVSDHTS